MLPLQSLERRASNHSWNFADLFDKEVLSDCCIELVPERDLSDDDGDEGQTSRKRAKQVIRSIHVSRAVLSSQSEFFKSLFAGSFAERGQRMVELKVSGRTEADLVYKTIRAVYFDRLEDTISLPEAIQGLQIAKQYLLSAVEGLYTQFIKEKIQSPEDLFEVILVPDNADSPLLDNIADAIMVVLEKYFEDFEQNVLGGAVTAANTPGPCKHVSRFVRLPVRFAERLLQSDKLRVSSENAIYTAAMTFLRSRKGLDTESSRRILLTPRYNLIHPSIVTYSVLREELITSDPVVLAKVCEQIANSRLPVPIREPGTCSNGNPPPKIVLTIKKNTDDTWTCSEEQCMFFLVDGLFAKLFTMEKGVYFHRPTRWLFDTLFTFELKSTEPVLDIPGLIGQPIRRTVNRDISDAQPLDFTHMANGVLFEWIMSHPHATVLQGCQAVTWEVRLQVAFAKDAATGV